MISILQGSVIISVFILLNKIILAEDIENIEKNPSIVKPNTLNVNDIVKTNKAFKPDKKKNYFEYNSTDINSTNFYESLKIKEQSLVIFRLDDTCAVCNRALTNVDKIISNKNESSEIKVNDTNFYTVNCKTDYKICLNFNIENLPYTVLIKGDKMKVFSDFPNSSNLLNFILSEDNFSTDLPQDLSFISYNLLILKKAPIVIADYINMNLRNLNINFTWENYHSYIFLTFSTILIISLQYLIIECIFTSKKTSLKVDKVE